MEKIPLEDVPGLLCESGWIIANGMREIAYIFLYIINIKIKIAFKRVRTSDLPVNSRMLYLLSYESMLCTKNK